jgi:hypothetical protein
MDSVIAIGLLMLIACVYFLIIIQTITIARDIRTLWRVRNRVITYIYALWLEKLWVQAQTELGISSI